MTEGWKLEYLQGRSVNSQNTERPLLVVFLKGIEKKKKEVLQINNCILDNKNYVDLL